MLFTYIIREPLVGFVREIELFKDYDLETNMEHIHAKCFKCGNRHVATKLYGFWWFYSSAFSWDMMYREIKRSGVGLK